MKELWCDILIVGGGLTGLMTAFALSSLKKNIIVIDKYDFIKSSKKINDLRTTAIAEGSKIFFEKINIWSALAKYAKPIKFIKVIDREDHKKIHFQNQKKNKNLGYIIKNNIIKNILVNILQNKKNVTMIKGSTLVKLLYVDDFVLAKLDNKNIKASLLIAADGKNSIVRKILKTPVYFKKYNHKAMVVNFNHTTDHKNTAYELFYDSGPLAILPMMPMKKNLFSSSVIWSNTDNFVTQMSKVDKSLIKKIIEEKTSKYLGQINNIVDLQTFNLSAHINRKFYDRRLIYIGDSAHSIHPIAGQGWNLGIRDIQNIFNIIEGGLSLGLDLGDKFICEQYHNESFYDASTLYQITDKLNSMFLNKNFISTKFRQIGFSFIENNKILKNYITNFAMGI